MGILQTPGLLASLMGGTVAKPECGSINPDNGQPCVMTTAHTKHKTAACKRWTSAS